MLIAKMPEIASALAAPMAQIDKITLVSSGGSDSTGVEKITKGVTEVIAQVPGVVEMLSGLNLAEMAAKVPALNGKTRAAAAK